MELRNCPNCGKLFVYVTKNLCPACAKKDEENFRNVKDYLYDNPGATIDEVSEETGVDTKKILEYLKEGRLILKQNNASILSCESCGKPILTGRFCKNCITDMKQKFGVSTKLPTSEDMKGQIHINKLKRRRK